MVRAGREGMRRRGVRRWKAWVCMRGRIRGETRKRERAALEGAIVIRGKGG